MNVTFIIGKLAPPFRSARPGLVASASQRGAPRETLAAGLLRQLERDSVSAEHAPVRASQRGEAHALCARRGVLPRVACAFAVV